MSNKLISYETSNALAEAGFEIEEYTGYWLAPLVTKNYKQPEPLWVNGRQHEAMEYRDAGGDINQNFYASYDCHDLLTWFEGYLNSEECFKYSANAATLWTPGNGWLAGVNDKEQYAKQPQEALAKAIIEILKERQCKK
jgi:hypothetical protein